MSRIGTAFVMQHNDVVGFLDIWTDASVPPTGPLQVQGWVVDPIAPPTAIVVTVNGKGVALARHGLARPDVAAAYPSLTGASTSGWSARIERADGLDDLATVGAHVVRANGATVLLGQAPLRQVARPISPPDDLVGFIDLWGDRGPLTSGRLQVQGWVVDRQGPPFAVMLSIERKPVAFARLGLPRPDVAAAHADLPGAATSGWEATIYVEERQDDRAIVAAQVVRANGEVVHCRQAPLRDVARHLAYPRAALGPVPPAVFGGLDAPSGNGLVFRGPLEISGWAVDTQAAPLALVVTVGGKGVGIGRFGYPRSTEAVLYPWLDGVGVSGWVANVDLSDAPLGTVDVTAWLGRTNGDFVEIGRVPMWILGGYDSAPPRALLTPSPDAEPRLHWSEIPGWFLWRSAQEAAARRFPAGSCFIEVGSSLGRSLCSLGEVVQQSGKTFTVIGVDTHRGSGPKGPSQKDYHGAVGAQAGSTFAGALYKNISDCGYGEAITVIIADSLTASRLFGDASVEWVHLNACHDYVSVKADIQAWLPKVKPGGWLSGDDYDEVKWPDVVRAVGESLPGAQAWSVQQWRWVVE